MRVQSEEEGERRERRPKAVPERRVVLHGRVVRYAYQNKMAMDDLVNAWSERDAATVALYHTARLRRWTIWNAARLLRDADMPHMSDSTLDTLTELAYMSPFPCSPGSAVGVRRSDRARVGGVAPVFFASARDRKKIAGVGSRRHRYR